MTGFDSATGNNSTPRKSGHRTGEWITRATLPTSGIGSRRWWRTSRRAGVHTNRTFLSNLFFLVNCLISTWTSGPPTPIRSCPRRSGAGTPSRYAVWSGWPSRAGTRLWHSRWLELQKQLTGNGPIAVESGYWCAAGDTDAALRTIDATLQERTTLVVLLPSEPPRTVGADEVSIGFRNGVPVMVWHRHDCRSDEFVNMAKSVLHGGEPHDVRERIRRVRLRGYEAGVDARHVGSHITLLWDDPGRKVTPDLARPPEQVAS